MQIRDLPYLRAVAYARYSTNHQTKLSIERQLELIGEHCEHEGIQLVDCYVDEAQTGTNMEREDFQRLLADAERGAVFKVFCKRDLRRMRVVISAGGGDLSQRTVAQPPPKAAGS